jgi:hypothetical protein
MSALTPKADTKADGPHVRFGPKADSHTATLTVRRKQKDRLAAVSPKSVLWIGRHSMRGPPFGSPSNALIFPLWLVPSCLVTSYSADPHVDYAGLRQQRSQLRLDYQREPWHPLRSSPSLVLRGSTQPLSLEAKKLRDAKSFPI